MESLFERVARMALQVMAAGMVGEAMSRAIVSGLAGILRAFIAMTAFPGFVRILLLCCRQRQATFLAGIRQGASRAAARTGILMNPADAENDSHQCGKDYQKYDGILPYEVLFHPFKFSNWSCRALR